MEADGEIESFMFSITGKQEKMNITNKINNIFTIYVFKSMDAWESIHNPREPKPMMNIHLIFKASLPILLHLLWFYTFQKVHTDRLS